MNRVAMPPNWSRGLSPAAWFGVAVLIGGSIQFWVQTFAATQRASVSSALGSAGLAVFCMGGIAALILTVRASAARHADWSAAGTTVRTHPAIALSWIVALVGGAIGSTFTVLFASVSTVNRYLLGCLLVISVLGLCAFARSRAAGYVRIGPDGVAYRDIVRARTARWDEIHDIASHADSRARNPIVLVLDGGTPVVVANADRFASAGPTLYWMVRHYWLHPEARGELANGRALQRLQDNDFEPE